MCSASRPNLLGAAHRARHAQPPMFKVKPGNTQEWLICNCITLPKRQMRLRFITDVYGMSSSGPPTKRHEHFSSAFNRIMLCNKWHGFPRITYRVHHASWQHIFPILFRSQHQPPIVVLDFRESCSHVYVRPIGCLM